MAQFFQPKKGKSNRSKVPKGRSTVHSLASLQPDSNTQNASEIISINKLDHTGKGISFSTQPITIVENALANETCEVKVYQASKKVRNARVLKVIEKNEYRQEPFCQYYEKCGGCTLQHVQAEYALSEKYAALQGYLSHQHQVVADKWLAPIRSDINYTSSNTIPGKNSVNEATAYRRRIRLAVDARNKNKVKVGYRERKSQRVIDIQNCPIALAPIQSALLPINTMLKGFPSIASVGHIVITVADTLAYTHESFAEDTIQLALFVTQTLSAKSIMYLQEFVQSQALPISVVVKSKQAEPVLINALSESLPILNQQNTLLQGAPHHFLQVNARVNDAMLRTAADWLNPKPNQVLYDFFCGSGNFSLMLAPKVKSVLGFEGVNEMVELAQHNAAVNNIENCTFATCDLSDERALAQISMEKDSLVILDPSREGALELCIALANKAVSKILYVSCNPNSFARDLKHLQTHYKIDKITALDMFPFTSHLEVMALLVAKQ
ncbi:23S rRNA (uracil(1939)-C(5))-methyltransferase RlmD [Glaciecola sp. 2405UD65-10]|uniref:23S rRNA (uracil(1939)-C(5))-methyltransferase RlmD n=1 Tax=Glaciecola sp. 2405UD65-10 TaxID=3397244 RepID=UPI003B5BA2FB